MTNRSLRAVTTVGLAACGLLGTACTRDRPIAGSPIGGSLVISTVADADVLLPPLALTGTALQVVDNVFDRLLQPSISAEGVLETRPALATSYAFSGDSLAIDFTLDARARWHDGTPVTAGDVRFTWEAYADSTLGSPSRTAIRSIDSVQVRSAETVRFWFSTRSAAQLDVAATEMRILPRHLLDSIPRDRWRTAAFARAPIGSGRFRFASWQANTRIEVVSDTGNYRGRARLDRVIWSVAPDPAAVVLRLRTGDADFLENVRPDAVGDLTAMPGVVLLRSPGLAYGYLQFNLLAPGSNTAAHPIFGDRDTRRALSQALNREALVQLVFDSLARVALGPLTRLHVGTDTILPVPLFDTVAAARALDAQGWRADTAGAIRTRNGVPLTFSVLVPASSTPRVRLATFMQPMWRRLGVDMRIVSLEFPAFMAKLGSGDFDAAVMAIGADLQPSGIAGVWGSAASRQFGGPNFGSYRSVEFDSAVSAANSIPNPIAARAAYLQAYRVILNEAPAVWLFEPYTLGAMVRDITPVGVRPDAWWANLADWSRTSASASGRDTAR
jgi:peptide/nickel transport system substrate-binding protein